MRQQKFTALIIYSNLIHNKWELTPFRCIRCGRMLFKTKGDVLWITNSAGIPLSSIDPELAYIEHQCHSCKSLFRVLFQ